MLSQRQLLVASRLFVAAGKAGHPFDLSKFSNDLNFANSTLATLRSHPSAGALRPLVDEMAFELMSTPTDARTAVPTPPKEVAVPNTPPADEDAPKKYVGRLR